MTKLELLIEKYIRPFNLGEIYYIGLNEELKIEKISYDIASDIETIKSANINLNDIENFKLEVLKLWARGYIRKIIAKNPQIFDARLGFRPETFEIERIYKSLDTKSMTKKDIYLAIRNEVNNIRRSENELSLINPDVYSLFHSILAFNISNPLLNDESNEEFSKFLYELYKNNEFANYPEIMDYIEKH